MTRLYCTGPALLRAVGSAVTNLERHVAEVDALNVFPVPDGDTGTNMLATMRAAYAEAERLPPGERSLAAVAEALSRGALLGARGNSGVILSQIIRGMTVGALGERRATGIHLSVALRKASEQAYGAVRDPVEGTILTVIRDAAEAAEAEADRAPHVESVLSAAVEAAARSVARTPMLLPVLRDAGVVDSGAQGLYRLLQGTLLLEDAISLDLPFAGIRIPTLVEPGSNGLHGADLPGHGHGGLAQEPPADGYGYETMYLLEAGDGPLDVTRIREDLGRLGDSVLVAGDERAVKVHVHGPRPDMVIGYGLALGRLRDVTVEDLDRQTIEHRALDRPHPASVAASGLAVVAVATGDGLARVLRAAGAAAIVRPAHGTRPSSGEIVESILALGAREVIVLPNDAESRLAAEQVGRILPDIAVTVVPTRDAAEGVAALLAFDPEAGLSVNAQAMGRASGQIRSFAVTTAVRDALLDGRSVREGDTLALGPDDGILASGTDLAATVLEAIGRAGADAELVTLYRGAGSDEAAAADLAARIGQRYPAMEVDIVDGDQPFQRFLVAVE